jgi:hypothetical protein
MATWVHRLFNPHCEHCKEEREDSRICSSCETLRLQLEISNSEKRQLLERILEKPVVVNSTGPVEMTKPMNVPWNVRRQMLEAEDRVKARLMREAPIPTEDLEKEMDIAAEKRDAIK